MARSGGAGKDDGGEKRKKPSTPSTRRNTEEKESGGNHNTSSSRGSTSVGNSTKPSVARQKGNYSQSKRHNKVDTASRSSNGPPVIPGSSYKAYHKGRGYKVNNRNIILSVDFFALYSLNIHFF